MTAHDNVAVERHVKLISPNVSTNPFSTDIREAVRADMDSVDPTGGRYVGGGESNNPFLVSMELTTGATELAAGGAASCPQTPLLNRAWPPTPPSSVPTNPFLTATRQESAAGSESMFPPQYCYDGPRHMASTPAVALHYGTNNDVNQTSDGQPANPFSPVNYVYAAINAPFTPVHTPAPQPAVPSFTPCMSQSVRNSYAEQAHDYYSAPHRDAPLPRGREPDSGGYGQPSWRRAKSAPQRLSSLYGQ